MFKLLLLSAGILGLAMAGLAIKIWAKKDGEFEGTCASKNVKLKAQGIGCGCGGGHGACQNEGKHDHDHDHAQEHDKLEQRIFVKSVKR
jgi:hypothetical protein